MPLPDRPRRKLRFPRVPSRADSSRLILARQPATTSSAPESPHVHCRSREALSMQRGGVHALGSLASIPLRSARVRLVTERPNIRALAPATARIMGPCADIVLSAGSSSFAFGWTGDCHGEATVFSKHSVWGAAVSKRWLVALRPSSSWPPALALRATVEFGASDLPSAAVLHAHARLIAPSRRSFAHFACCNCKPVAMSPPAPSQFCS
ncbi:unnamed protein product [Blumeria hordei]|uniref:Uncharacterized protein n=1 Tax=Blumeria hordei TaxID=2867405 RepID=A0A383UW10_BLUHO|nr:unnamed protein product [Blumeria hordei]